MKKFYLYSFIKEINIEGETTLEKFLVIYYPYQQLLLQPSDIYNQLRLYFQHNILPNKIVALFSSYNQDEMLNLFQSGSELYDYIPLFTLDDGYKNISLNSLESDGSMKTLNGFEIEPKFGHEILNRGMVKIFNSKGGLIVSQSAHHFVFPSGKHSDRFLRPGNVLLKSIHINFIAYALFRHLKGRKYTSIYCDTSSINSLAYAYIDLIRKFDKSFDSSIQIESFGSYRGFELEKFSAPKDSLFLISSSTSGSIIKRMQSDKKKIIQRDNICIIYGLSVETSYASNVICDLTKDEKLNPDGIYPFESYNVKKEPCKFCEDNSKPIEIKGDVFLLEKPSITGKLLNISDNPLLLKKFAPYFNRSPSSESIIKCFFKEKSIDDKNYEVFIDIETILKEWPNRHPKHPFEKIFDKLEKYVIQNIPASLKYFIVLPDLSSHNLANLILDILSKNGTSLNPSSILKLSEIDKIDKKGKGCIAIISSSISSGRNLLFISRALREYEDKYQRLYFTFINRTANEKHFNFLESNLSLGEFGKGSHKIINVEQIFCTNEAYNTPWHIEKEFLKKLQEFLEINGGSPITEQFCRERIEILNKNGATRGLSNNLFFKSLLGKELKINKGFAYAPPGNDFIKNSTQADIYFIISTILNECRCTGKLDQSEYVRNLLEPGNFVRFNDGIIQAAILRAATNDELRYDLSDEMSFQIKNILEDMLNHIKDEHAEGLLEFIYAIAIKKLRLKNEMIKSCIDLIEIKNLLKGDSVLNGLVLYIRESIIK